MEMKVLTALPALSRLAVSSSLLSASATTRVEDPIPEIVLHEARQRILALFQLNPSQLEVLDAVLLRLHQDASPLLLIQGVFGSGKSLLISSLLILLHSLHQLRSTLADRDTDFLKLGEIPCVVEALSAPSRRRRRAHHLNVLFCSHTNVAVDRVCLLLLQHGFRAFRRTGNIRRIHPSLREFYGSRKNDEGEDRVLCTTLCSLPEDLSAIDVVIIDEASQITEYYVHSPTLHHTVGVAASVGREPAAGVADRGPEAAAARSHRYMTLSLLTGRRNPSGEHLPL